MAVAAPHADAAGLTCGVVSSYMAQCVPYLTGGPGPSPACCNGIKDLVSAASTPQDRKTACGCLKSAAASTKGINYSTADALPGKCGVNVPYTIRPSTDCSKYALFPRNISISLINLMN